MRALLVLGLILATDAWADAFRFVTLDFPPLEYAETPAGGKVAATAATPATSAIQTTKATGAVVEIVRDIMAHLGHTVVIEVLPWTRSINLVKDGKADAIFTCYRNPAREEFLEYTTVPLIPQVVALYVKKGSGRTYSGELKDLAGANIGIISTISYGQAFDRAKDGLKLKTERVEDLDLNFKKLLAGRLDYVISNRYSAEFEIEKMGISDQVIELERPVEVIPSYIGFSRKNNLGKLREGFEKELTALKRSGRYLEILSRYKVRVPKES